MDDTSLESLRLGVIRASGSDAEKFLRAQLSNDISRLAPGQHFLAAWCDAKGRTQLVLRVIATSDAYLLLLPQAVVESALKRLRMFVLRLQVELADISADYDIAGLLDVETSLEVNAANERDDHLWLGLPSSSDLVTRILVLHPAGEAPPTGAVATDTHAWQLTEIDAGLPQITAATQGEFVPQMLNLHWLMALDFDKGCYPGQEVIARLHYRGRLTRRTFRVGWRGDYCPLPGEQVHDDDGNNAGQILQAAGHNDEGRALAVLRIESVAQGGLRTENGHLLAPLELPYATTD